MPLNIGNATKRQIIAFFVSSKVFQLFWNLGRWNCFKLRVDLLEPPWRIQLKFKIFCFWTLKFLKLKERDWKYFACTGYHIWSTKCVTIEQQLICICLTSLRAVSALQKNLFIFVDLLSKMQIWLMQNFIFSKNQKFLVLELLFQMVLY